MLHHCPYHNPHEIYVPGEKPRIGATLFEELLFFSSEGWREKTLSVSSNHVWREKHLQGRGGDRKSVV